ncbi:MAG: hypothetical protein ACQETJ_12345 [Bacteroidota bacterium]
MATIVSLMIYDEWQLEHLRHCIFYHGDGLEHPGGLIFYDHDLLEQRAG